MNVRMCPSGCGLPVVTALVTPQVPFPGCERLSAAAAAYISSQPSRSYYDDLIAAHSAAGLVLETPQRRSHSPSPATAHVYLGADAQQGLTLRDVR